MDEIIEIANIELTDLETNPAQLDIYGETLLEKEFLISVKERGIVTPLIVCESAIYGDACETDKPYIIISGHRRRDAAAQIGLKNAPCIVKNYETLETAKLDFLVSNMQREKSLSQRIKEYFSMKEAVLKYSQLPKNKRSWENTSFTDSDLARILAKSAKDDKSDKKSIDMYEVLKEQCGFSEYEQTCINVLRGADWLQNSLDKMIKNGVPKEKLDAFVMIRDEAAQAYENNIEKLNAATTRVKNTMQSYISEFGKIEKKEEKVKKIEKIEKKEESIKPEKTVEQKKEAEPMPDVLEVIAVTDMATSYFVFDEKSGAIKGIQIVSKLGNTLFFTPEKLTEILYNAKVEDFV